MQTDVLLVSLAITGFLILAQHYLVAYWKRTPKEPAPHKAAWMPDTAEDRALYSALFIAGEPVTNQKLSELMGVSKGECSKRVTSAGDHIVRTRTGREVHISLA